MHTRALPADTGEDSAHNVHNAHHVHNAHNAYKPAPTTFPPQSRTLYPLLCTKYCQNPLHSQESHQKQPFMTYPDTWPKPSSKRPKALASRITEQQKHDLYNRSITTRALATLLGVQEAYVSHLFPGKAPTTSSCKKVLTAVRKEFRTAQAVRVLQGQITITQAAHICSIHYRNMARAVQHLKAALKEAANPLTDAAGEAPPTLNPPPEATP